MYSLKDEDKEYEDGFASLSYVREHLPAYQNSYDQPLQELFREITQRPGFTYDPNDDALYQGYKQSYAQQGRLAMEDSIGYAAGLTGGYGSIVCRPLGAGLGQMAQSEGDQERNLSTLGPDTELNGVCQPTECAHLWCWRSPA